MHTTGPRDEWGDILGRALALAAAPTFAVMAALSAADPAAMLCASGPLSGMTTMYALMAAFHLRPWSVFRRSGRRFGEENALNKRVSPAERLPRSRSA